jgi:hypothetical protein
VRGRRRFFFETFSTFYDFHLGSFTIRDGATVAGVYRRNGVSGSTALMGRKGHDDRHTGGCERIDN